jgi:hypothetical protein
MKTKLITLLMFALSLASLFAKAKWGFYGFHDGV